MTEPEPEPEGWTYVSVVLPLAGCRIDHDAGTVTYTLSDAAWREWLPAFLSAVQGLPVDGWPVRGSG